SQGLANSVTALDDIDSMVINPAVMGSVRKFQTGAHFLSSFRTPQGDADFRNYSLNFLHPRMFYGKFGTFGAVFRYQDSALSQTEKTFQFGYSTWQFLRTSKGVVDFGFNLKILQAASKKSNDSAMGLGFDAGAVLRAVSGYNFGLSFLNINNPSFNLVDLKDKAPFVMRFGVSRSKQDYVISADFASRTSSGGSDGSYTASSGFEYLWRTYRWGIFSTRAGLNLGGDSSSFALGFSYKHLASEIYYAMLIPLTRSVVVGHGLSVILRFGDRDTESEYEKLIKQEVKYRKDLLEALEESSRREMSMKNELKELKEDVGGLTRKIKEETRKNIEITKVKRDLETAMERQKIEERERLLQKKFQFGRDFESYLRLKAGGAPVPVLKGVLQRIITQYQGSGVDISQATLELQKLITENRE
ncbi:MAG: hypothetical protein HY746_04450, partial [Elusimicrobia bacterium]|nr:hypothetical protein [Elusimicrobiota bacterium]